MVRHDSQLGLATLRLLAERSSACLLRALADRPLQPSNLEGSLPDLPHSAVMRLLGELTRAGALARERVSAVPPRTFYNLTAAGRELLPIFEAGERWERRWSSLARQGEPGTWAIGLVADTATRTILLALADGPLRPIEIDRYLPDLARSATRRRLSDLLAHGVLARSHQGQHVRYALTPAARRLGLISVLAGRWEWEWSEPASAGDLPGLLRLLAPAVQLPEPLNGVCRVHIDARGADPADVYLSAQAGELVALPAAPSDPPNANGHAPPHVWCNALLNRNLSGIATSGNSALMLGVLMSVSAALVT